MQRGIPSSSFPRWGAVLGLLACATAPLWSNPQITDITLKFAGKTAAEIHFAPPEDGQPFSFPPYFQQIDSARKTALFSFLETETALPVGFTPLPSRAPVAGVAIQRFRSPSGKNFLGIEFSLKALPTATEWSLIPSGTTLKILLGKGSKSGSMPAWSLAQGNPSPSVSPNPPPAEAVEPAAPAAAPVAPAVPAAAKASAVVAVAAPAPAKSGSLREIQVTASGSREEVTFLFQGEVPDYKVENTAGASPALGIDFHHTSAASPESKFDLGSFGSVRGLLWKQHDSDLVAVVLLDSTRSPQTSGEKHRLILRFPLPAGTPAFTWSSRHPETPHLSVGPLPSAFAEGAILDQKHAHPLSGSRVFNLTEDGKPMVVVRDSVPLLAAAVKSSAVQRWIFAGETLRKLGSHGGYLRVVSGNDSGYLAAAAAAYADELTATQNHALQTKIRARAAAQAAAAQPPPQRAAEPPLPSPASKPAVAERGKKAQEPKLSMPPAGEKMEIPPAILNAEQKAADSEKVDLTPHSEQVTYNSYGRRDPFIPVEEGSPDNGIDIDEMKVVGIVSQGQEPMAVLENIKESNLSFTVRQGDPVHNGRVSHITHDAVTFDLTEFGITRSYTLKLVPSQERVGK